MKPCNQCGKCCINYSHGGLSATADEIEYWEIFRPDIARFVSNGEIWIDPSSGELLKLCPWLRKAEDADLYSCDIYHDRPNDCKAYPTDLKQMIGDECEMLEPEDMSSPKLGAARLKVIMSDSWSSLRDH